MKHVLAALLGATIFTVGPAQADHYMQTADPQVVQALNEMAWVYGGLCQQGNGQACQSYNYIQQAGGEMLNAGYDCQTNGNAQSCQVYQNYYGQLEQAYVATQQAMNQGVLTQPQQGTTGTTHAQRMQQIHDWGQQALANGRANSAMMDQNHQQFLDYIRQ